MFVCFSHLLPKILQLAEHGTQLSLDFALRVVQTPLSEPGAKPATIG